MDENAGKSDPKSMLHYMPEIIWHDRDSLLSVDFQAQPEGQQFYMLVTTSLRKEVRIWKMDFRMLSIGTEDLGIFFIANLVGHRTTVNSARFSPNGELLVSGDCDGGLIVWKISRDTPNLTLLREDDFPPNVENWVRYKTPSSHDSDICSICWSPDSQHFVTASNDESVAVYEANTGKQLWRVKSFRRFPNGVTWDPRGKYIVTMSTDRKLDILCAKKGSRLRCIQNVNLPDSTFGKSNLTAGMYKLFHDDQLMSFSRIAEFSPDGELLFVPSGNLETASFNIFGTFIFRRRDFGSDRPVAFIPSSKATFRVSCCPVFYKLRESVSENALRLPYRVVWAVLMKDAVTLFDSQLGRCIGYASNLQYDTLTDMAWSTDGRVLMISSLEGYISFIRFGEIALGEKYTGEIPRPLPSPQLDRKKKSQKRIHPIAKPEKREGSPVNSLFNYFKKLDTTAGKRRVVYNTGSPTLIKKRSDALIAQEKLVKKEEAGPSTSKPKAVEKRASNISSSERESDTEQGTRKKPEKKRAKILVTSPLEKLD